MSKRRVDEVDEGVIVVVREAPNDKVREEVDRWGAEKMFEWASEDSFSRLSLVVRGSPETQKVTVE